MASPLDALHQTFLDWFGQHYDLGAIDAVLATAAAERLTGDPLWLLLVSGSGNAKTETVCALASLPHTIVTSTVASEGALLSGTAAREKAKDATGGLLRRLGPRGLLVIKDVTSLISISRDARASVLAALREVYDGRWERNVGIDGGRTLTWTGRVAVVGAVTTAWDRAHDVVAAMGDRFVVCRMDSFRSRPGASYKALANTGDEVPMRAALSAAVAAVLATVNPCAIKPTPAETDVLVMAADIVTLCRTGVDFDYRGDVIDAHAPEMPTRFAKQLLQIMRGACAIGMDRDQALRLAIRCARDSMPPLRLAILDDVAANPGTRARDVRQRLNKPYNTVARQLQALHMLTVLECDEIEGAANGKSTWHYRVEARIDPAAIQNPPPIENPIPDLAGQAHRTQKKKSGSEEGDHTPTAKSGTGFEPGYLMKS